jgi:hypothetical protein
VTGAADPLGRAVARLNKVVGTSAGALRPQAEAARQTMNAERRTGKQFSVFSF